MDPTDGYSTGPRVGDNSIFIPREMDKWKERQILYSHSQNPIVL